MNPNIIIISFSLTLKSVCDGPSTQDNCLAAKLEKKNCKERKKLCCEDEPKQLNLTRLHIIFFSDILSGSGGKTLEVMFSNTSYTREKM